jgi:hypothetical protein
MQVRGKLVSSWSQHACPRSEAQRRASRPLGPAEPAVDIVAGKWRTDGGQGCYWARLKPDRRDIIDNNIVNGPEIVWLKDGELFETARCGSWSVARS